MPLPAVTKSLGTTGAASRGRQPPDMTPRTPRHIDWLATAALTATMICWGTVPVFLKYFADYIDFWTANGLRYPISAALYLPLLLTFWRRGLLPPGLLRRAWIPVIPNVFGQMLWGISPYYADASLVGFLVRISIVWSIVVSFLLFREERALLTSRRFWVGIALAIAGCIGVTTLGQPIHWGTTGLGILFILLASLFFALYGIAVKATMRRVNPFVAFSVISLYTSLILVLLMGLFGRPAQALHLSPLQWLLLVISSVLGIAAGHGLYYTAIKRLGVAIASGAGLVLPFFTAGLARVILGEHLSAGQWCSGAILVIGAGLLIWAQQRILAARQPADHAAPAPGGPLLPTPTASPLTTRSTT